MRRVSISDLVINSGPRARASGTDVPHPATCRPAADLGARASRPLDVSILNIPRL